MHNLTGFGLSVSSQPFVTNTCLLLFMHEIWFQSENADRDRWVYAIWLPCVPRNLCRGGQALPVECRGLRLALQKISALGKSSSGGSHGKFIFISCPWYFEIELRATRICEDLNFSCFLLQGYHGGFFAHSIFAIRRAWRCRGDDGPFYRKVERIRFRDLPLCNLSDRCCYWTGKATWRE